jgi:hypothetical protein
LNFLRQLLHRTPFYGVYKSLGHYPDYLYWKLRGKPPRAPHLVKQRAVREYGDKYGLRVLVETGTYYGEMVAAMKNQFELIYSVEYDPELAGRAVQRFARHPNIQILQGDSRQLLPELLKMLTQPSLFWLDAGYYGWSGTQGDSGRLSMELEAILRHPVKGHIILIDDARGFNGQGGTLTVEELKRHLESEFPDRVVEVRYDLMRITPRL